MDANELTIRKLIKTGADTPAVLNSIKRQIAKIHKISCENNISLLKTYHEMVKNKRIKSSARMETLLRTRPVRSLSGIVNISVLTKPYACPGKCLYCPSEKNIPKSYVSGEPAVERAKRLDYDPYLQVQKRIEMLEMEGHPTDKIELRIVGGTWSYYSQKYQKWFVRRCFEAANGVKAKGRIRDNGLEQAQKINENTKHRIIGLSVETRPDFVNPQEIKRLRHLGATMVELGVQSIYDDVLNANQRGHGVKETILATKLLKDAGFKVLYQMMPNLLGSDQKRDQKMFQEIFSNPDFQPDLLKIYPCGLLKKTPLYGLWKRGKYEPYKKEWLIALIKNIKKDIPIYARIQRIARDIPSKAIVVGPAKISNLRQILTEDMQKSDWRCRCIRCREIKNNYNPQAKLHLFRYNYKASDGKEIFLSFEDVNQENLYSLLRLRLPSSADHAIIREVHTFGQQLSLETGMDLQGQSPQHKGLGKKLIQEAEKIAGKEFKAKKIAVISGVGARGYYRKLGYKLKDSYMVKNLSAS